MKQAAYLINIICLFAVLGVAVWQDIRTKKIKNKLNVTGVCLGLLFAILLPERDILSALFGFFVMLAAGLLCWNLHVFRAGDAKLLCVVGAFLGWKKGVSCLLTAIILGAIIGLPLFLRRLYKRQKGLTKFPFSIAITAACLLGECFGYLLEIIDKLGC